MDSALSTFKEFSKNGLGTPLLLVMMFSMMIVPLPPFALDLVFTFNIAFALIIILVSIYTLRPLDFAVFPTVLLVATMLRLSLNVASTRVVLINGHTGTGAAGNVIESFGNFVVGGNYAVGFVIFAILVIINFVVVTKGAGRVSEVSARFTLDAMPGKQMAIDADLNSGLISPEEALQRREDISKEADFYGSMDGASKFVRGDAIAGILIIFINIIGGLAVGMGQHNLSFGVATQNYLLLSIGDGLVAQIPSLLLSTATAIIVTRVSASQNMGETVLKQVFSDKRVWMITAAIIGGMGLIPGMPNVVFLIIAAMCIVFSRVASSSVKTVDEDETMLDEENETEPEDVELGWGDMQSVDIIRLEVGYRLISLVDKEQQGELIGRIKGVRKKVSQDLGFLLQPVHIRDNLDLPANNYRIVIQGVIEGEGEVYTERELAINPGNVSGKIDGIVTKDPAFEMDAIWIEPSQRDQAQTLGYTVVDPSTVVATHLSKILRESAHYFLGYEETKQLLDKLADRSPQLVEDLVPKTLPMSAVVKVMQNLLQEGVPIRDIRTIVETLAEAANTSQNTDALTGITRIALRRAIVQEINGMRKDLSVFTLSPKLEQLLQKTIHEGPESYFALEPTLAEKMQDSVRDLAQQQEAVGLPPVLLVTSGLRIMLSKLFRTSVKNLHILSFDEIPESKSISIMASVGDQHDGVPQLPEVAA
ncbi:MAG: flagellar biosynthesis protein FlhA [Gammaproteobacteria bacterium]|nr:MAG: flagellar biosynthesis protein FlhA [Gammaproteobacteria bacterium]